MSSGYRDDLASAEERLSRLDAAHEERQRRRRREELDAQRQKVRARSVGKGMAAIPYLGGLIAIYALKYALMYPNSAGPGSLVLFLVASCVTVCVAALVLLQRRQRRQELSRIDAEIRELEQPRVRVAPATLAEALSRIAELEDEAQRLALGEEEDAPPSAREARSGGDGA